MQIEGGGEKGKKKKEKKKRPPTDRGQFLGAFLFSSIGCKQRSGSGRSGERRRERNGSSSQFRSRATSTVAAHALLRAREKGEKGKRTILNLALLCQLVPQEPDEEKKEGRGGAKEENNKLPRT